MKKLIIIGGGEHAGVVAEAAIMQPDKWDIIGFIGATVILMYSGAIALFVGLLVSIPVSTLSYVIFYNALLKRKK